MAKELLKKEVIFQSDLEALIGKRPFKHPTAYEEFTKRVEEKEKKAREKAKKEDQEITLDAENKNSNDKTGAGKKGSNGLGEISTTDEAPGAGDKSPEKPIEEH